MTSEKDQGIDDVGIDRNPFDILGSTITSEIPIPGGSFLRN